MKRAILDDTISVLDFSVVYKSSFRKTILLVTLVLSVISPIYKIFKSLWYHLRFHIPYIYMQNLSITST